jgi:predicted  nucleic acid-binding Zn-ribbon protein
MSEVKETKEISVEEKLRALYDLQLVVSEIDKIKTLRGELPLEVQDLEDEITGLTTRVNNHKAEIKDAETAISNKKNEIENAKALTEKYKTQQENVRNNREFEALSKEIEFQGLEQELYEKKIREYTAILKQKTEELEKADTLIGERTLDLNQKKAELDEIVSETKQEEEKLREKAKGIEEIIEPRLLSAFKRIRKNARNGLAVVYVQRDACGGCFNKIPPQRQMDIRLRKKIIVCEYCGRILVDPELAGIE